MRLAVSNIAWPAEADDEIAGVLTGLGVSAIEVAPTKRWPDPSSATPEDAAAYRAEWAERGLRIVSMQSLLFGRDDLVIFGTENKRAAALDYLRRVMVLAGTLGAGPLVFGSPKNRRVESLPAAGVRRIAVEFFGALGNAATVSGVQFCLEPNPPEYGADFLTTSSAAVGLLAQIRNPGLGLHLDAAAMTLASERPAAAIAAAMPWLRHFHASEPYLAPIGTGGTDHGAFAAALAAEGYQGWISVEMRAVEGAAAAVAAVGDAVRRVQDAYARVI